jgi:HSP20 family protein
MALMKWEPFSTFEKMFEDFPLLPILPTFKSGWDLAVDLYEDKGNLVAEMNLPGVDPKQVEITFQNGNLMIHGKKLEEKELKEKGFYRKEIYRGEFEKLIQLPFEVKTDKTEAHYKEGVLKILMPMKEELKKPTVKVQIQ